MQNMLMINLGLIATMPTVVIPAISNLQNMQNQDEVLAGTSVEVSWVGSVLQILQPIGSIVSALASGNIRF